MRCINQFPDALYLYFLTHLIFHWEMEKMQESHPSLLFIQHKCAKFHKTKNKDFPASSHPTLSLWIFYLCQRSKLLFSYSLHIYVLFNRKNNSRKFGAFFGIKLPLKYLRPSSRQWEVDIKLLIGIMWPEINGAGQAYIQK